MQVTRLHKRFDMLQQVFGDPSLLSVYGAGCVSSPKTCFVFMNPTRKNPSAQHGRSGIRAPRIGFKQVRKMFFSLGVITDEQFEKTQSSLSWDHEFAEELYRHLAAQSIYITNLAKCTQTDAAALKDYVFKEYLPLMHEEISSIKPDKIITFGNQVSSVLLGKTITVAHYEHAQQYEELLIENETYKIYPCRYPVGMGYRNMDKAITRIQSII